MTLSILNKVTEFRVGQTLDDVKGNAQILSGIAVPPTSQQSITVNYIFVDNILASKFEPYVEFTNSWNTIFNNVSKNAKDKHKHHKDPPKDNIPFNEKQYTDVNPEPKDDKNRLERLSEFEFP
jgi:hypothetical protein